MVYFGYGIFLNIHNYNMQSILLTLVLRNKNHHCYIYIFMDIFIYKKCVTFK